MRIAVTAMDSCGISLPRGWNVLMGAGIKDPRP